MLYWAHCERASAWMCFHWSVYIENVALSCNWIEHHLYAKRFLELPTGDSSVFVHLVDYSPSRNSPSIFRFNSITAPGENTQLFSTNTHTDVKFHLRPKFYCESSFVRDFQNQISRQQFFRAHTRVQDFDSSFRSDGPCSRWLDYQTQEIILSEHTRCQRNDSKTERSVIGTYFHIFLLDLLNCQRDLFWAGWWLIGRCDCCDWLPHRANWPIEQGYFVIEIERFQERNNARTIGWSSSLIKTKKKICRIELINYKMSVPTHARSDCMRIVDFNTTESLIEYNLSTLTHGRFESKRGGWSQHSGDIY